MRKVGDPMMIPDTKAGKGGWMARRHYGGGTIMSGFRLITPLKAEGSGVYAESSEIGTRIRKEKGNWNFSSSRKNEKVRFREGGKELQQERK